MSILVIGAIAQIFTAVGKVFENFFKSSVSMVFVITLLVIFHYVGN
ncbi:hypothetical protein [Helicobacter labacensis]|nr:hypothetical protein [Helicobacter labacensis]